MNPLRLARKEPNLCDHNALDMAGYRCIFWGPLIGPGVAKINYFFHGLDPDGCLIADWERIRIKSIEKQDADTQKGFLAYWILTLQKKEKYFLRWIGTFYWQAPFNGCLNRQFANSVDMVRKPKITHFDMVRCPYLFSRYQYRILKGIYWNGLIQD